MAAVNFQMGDFTKVNGLMINKMDMEDNLMRMELNILVTFETTKSLAKEHTKQQNIISTKANGKKI